MERGTKPQASQPTTPQVYATAWRRCGIDSLLVPTTQKFMINHLVRTARERGDGASSQG